MQGKELLDIIEHVDMKKKFVILCFCFTFAVMFSQNNVKYCFSESFRWNGKKLSPKEQVIDAIRDTNKVHVNKTGDIWSNIVNSIFIEDREKGDKIPIIIDSSYVFCKIINITKKIDNYSVKGNKLIVQPIYLIDVECDNNDSMKQVTHMRIISILNKQNKKSGLKIKIGQTYKFYLISYFKKDCCKIVIGDKILEGLNHSSKTKHCFILNNIWVVNFDLNYNWYKTPNLNGLHLTLD